MRNDQRHDGCDENTTLTTGFLTRDLIMARAEFGELLRCTDSPCTPANDSVHLSLVPIELAAGNILAGRYRLDHLLGEGGMGVVWSATHVVTRKPVALKLLHASGPTDARFVQRFLREARAACAVQHPNVVVIHDVLELEDTTPVMVMELLVGESLGARLDRDHVLPIDELARTILPVVSAVGTAHAAGIVHRDLKPDNIFLTQTPEGIVVKVLDFGIAKLAHTDADGGQTGGLTGSGVMVGTPYYMAPEQIFGEKDIDHRADVWSLGILLFECLTGKRPTQADNVGQILKIVTTDKVPKLVETAPKVPADVATLVDRMLARDRESRPSLHEVREVLARYTSVTVRSFEAPVPMRSDSLPVDRLPTGDRVAVRTGDPVNPLGATYSAPSDASGSMQSPPAETLAAMSREHPRGNDRSVLRAGLVVGGVAVLGVLAFAGSRFISGPTSAVSSSSAQVSAVASSSPATNVPTMTATPSMMASTVSSVATTPSVATARPVVTHGTTKPTASASVIAPDHTANRLTTATPAGGVIDKPPF